MTIEGNIIFVTGGAGRIGSSICESIVKNKGKVIIADQDQEKGLKLENSLNSKSAKFIECDTTDEVSISKAIDLSSSFFGNINSAIHCAYPTSDGWGAKFEDLKSNDLFFDISSQLGGAILFSQKIISYFQKVGGGNLIHISSIQGLNAPKFDHYEDTNMSSPIEYSAIKSGIISITKYLSKYHKGRNIRVNVVSPGGILDEQPEIFKKNYKNSCLSKGLLDPEDLVGALIFLLSNESKYINGQNIIVDDGWSL